MEATTSADLSLPLFWIGLSTISTISSIIAGKRLINIGTLYTVGFSEIVTRLVQRRIINIARTLCFESILSHRWIVPLICLL